MTWNFPNCCGALDGRHIALRRPPDGRAELFKYRGRYSVVLLALVDADSKFLYVEVDTNGRADDMCVFRSSSLKTAIKNNSLNLPPDHVIIADNTFPLTTSIMKPFSKRDFSAVERIFNYRLSRARRVVDNAFGILAARFEVFRKEIELDVSTTDLIVRAACTIHNWLCTVSPETYLGKGWADFEDAETGEIHPGLWRETAVELPPLRTSRAVCPYTKEAAKKRNSIATYFSEEGQVPFQMRAIEM
ncbi:putative nuclease [Hyalella azteca]|nr:putative nuclease [Hyalella azteca]